MSSEISIRSISIRSGDWTSDLQNYASILQDDDVINSLTFQETNLEPLPQVTDVDDEVPYKGLVFDSADDAYEFYSSFAKINGFSIRRHHVYKAIKYESEENPSGIYKREYVCHRAGANKPTKVDEVESQRNRKSSRCNCNAKMFVSKTTIGIEEKWVVTYFNNSHNHELLDDKEVNFLPAYRDIPIPDQSRILLLSKAGCCIGLIMRILEAEKSISAGGLPFLERDIRNFIHDQSGIDKENDAADVLKLCKSLKDVDDAFQYDYTIDENRKLEHIIWAFGDSIRAYEAFGDVVLFDTTYRINRYEMPLGIWVGVDNHGNSIIFGCVLLRNEKIPSFTWALKNFLAFVKGKCPRTILTDQDPALKEAIAAELPNTKHAFCIWHIVAKLSSWFSSPLGERYNDFKYEFHKVYHLDSVDEFEQQWKLMVAQFDLSGDPHIKLLYSLRQCWALAYLKDFFFAGMTTTGRSESINSYIKHFLDAKTSLTDFVNKVGVAVQIRNHAGEEARMRQKYHNPRFRTSFPMEEHAASILTPYAFELIQLEIELSAKYAADETDSGSYMVKHHTKDGGGRTVTLIEGEKSILCSCKQFEFHGILCRHAIKVLLMKNYFQVPSKYLPFRWRRESSLVPKSSHMVNSDDSSSMEVRSLIQCLEYESLKTKERKQVATRGLEKLIREIKGMSESQENLTDLELGVPNNDDYDVENPILSKAKGRPKGSRPKGGVEAAKKVRRCHVPNCGGTNHDSRNCPNKRKNIEVLPTDSPYKATRGWRNRT